MLEAPLTHISMMSPFMKLKWLRSDGERDVKALRANLPDFVTFDRGNTFSSGSVALEILEFSPISSGGLPEFSVPLFFEVERWEESQLLVRAVFLLPMRHNLPQSASTSTLSSVLTTSLNSRISMVYVRIYVCTAAKDNFYLY